MGLQRVEPLSLSNKERSSCRVAKWHSWGHHSCEIVAANERASSSCAEGWSRLAQMFKQWEWFFSSSFTTSFTSGECEENLQSQGETQKSSLYLQLPCHSFQGSARPWSTGTQFHLSGQTLIGTLRFVPFHTHFLLAPPPLGWAPTMYQELGQVPGYSFEEANV